MKNFSRICRIPFSSSSLQGRGLVQAVPYSGPLPPIDSLQGCRTESSALISEAPTEVKYGLPIEEDLKSSSLSSVIRHQWSNVPGHTRQVLAEAHNASSSSSEWLLGDGPITSVKRGADAVLMLLGRGPADLQVHRNEYYNEHALVPMQKGRKAAYHWSRMLVPRTVAARCREDLRVDALAGGRSHLLLDRLMDKTSVVFCFSGYDLSGMNSGVKAWKTRLEDAAQTLQVLNIHFCQGWLSRRTHPLTRQILRSSFMGESSEQSETTINQNTFIYRGKWHRDLVLDFHLYNESLPSILLIDKKGYVRWHAVGLPTDECLDAMTPLLHKLTREKN